MALEITDGNFEEVVMKADKPVLIDFWAVWCGPCRMIAPFVEEMAKEFDGKAIVGKVDVDSNPGVAAQFGIRNIPTVLFVKDGQIADKQVGACPKQVLVNKLNALL
ncbi:MAG: thioredoxin [Bacteroidota bacterium]|mgnify:FL=1